MLHGISTAAFQLRTIYNMLSDEKYTTLAFDFYGRGHSSSSPQKVHNELLFGNQTLDLLDALVEKVQPPNVITRLGNFVKSTNSKI